MKVISSIQENWKNRSMGLSAVLSDLNSRRNESLNRLFDFLRIRSISTDPAYAKDCKAAAMWLYKEIGELGLNTELYKKSNHPIVFGFPKKIDKKKPTFLFYGHYDVQPADPIHLWTHDPFKPKIVKRNNKEVILGRGASDDKGQLLTFIEACRSVLNIFGELPFNLKILIEGEEESGSSSVATFLEANIDRVACDYAIICDTGFEQNTPCIYTMLRGELSQKVKISTACSDLHSGIYGGAITNPIKVLSEIIYKLHDKNAKIQIPGFYDDVIPISKTIKEEWQLLKFDEDKFLKDIGLETASGEPNYSIIERLWSRPSCEITGITGGYSGEGFKTIIPAQAEANISFRLVNNQCPNRIKDSFQEFIKKNLPSNCKVTFEGRDGTMSSNVSANSPLISIAQKALEQEWGIKPVLAGSGASIPIVTDLKRILKVDSLLLGFAQDGDNIHAPNEKYDLKSFVHGSNTWARIINELRSI